VKFGRSGTSHCVIPWWEARSGHGRSRPTRPEALPGPLAECISYALHVAGRAATRGLKAALDREGLELHEFGALAAIVSIGHVSQQELVRRLSIDRTTAGKVARILELEGLIERSRRAPDIRYWSLKPTPEGAERLERVMEAVAQAEAEFLDRLSSPERARLRDLLKVLGPPERGYYFDF
jgi:DNA-binding MarR family transcriptional regulator